MLTQLFSSSTEHHNPNFDEALAFLGERKTKKYNEYLKTNSKLVYRGLLNYLNMTDENVKALFSFVGKITSSDPLIHKINKTIKEKKTENLTPFRPYISLVLESLRKLPRYDLSKTVFKLVDLKGDSEKYLVGKTVRWNEFALISKTQEEALSATEKLKSPALIEISGSFVGYDLGLFLDEDCGECKLFLYNMTFLMLFAYSYHP